MGRVLMPWQSTFKPRRLASGPPRHSATTVNKRHAVVRRTSDAHQAANRIFDEAAIVDTETSDIRHELSDYASTELSAAAEARTNFDE